MSATSTQPSPNLTTPMSPLALTTSSSSCSSSTPLQNTTINNNNKMTINTVHSSPSSLSATAIPIQSSTTPTAANISTPPPPPPISTTTPTSTTSSTTTTTTTTTSLQLFSTKKEKLSAILGDGSFESIMKQRASKRREKDEQCIAELRYSISNMDRNLTQEIKRRIEAVKSLEKDTKRNIEMMEDTLYNAMESKLQSIQFRLKTMEDKVHELNERLEEERNKIPKDIEAKGMELKNMVKSFQEEFATERRDRLAREGQIMKQLSDHANEMRSTWQSESTRREECVQELSRRLDEHESNRAQADEGFENLIARELEALRGDIEREKAERMMEDDEIVDALNRYTENLQLSLSTLSMTGV